MDSLPKGASLPFIFRSIELPLWLCQFQLRSILVRSSYIRARALVDATAALPFKNQRSGDRYTASEPHRMSMAQGMPGG